LSLVNVLKQVRNWWDGATDEAAEAMKDPLRDHKLAIKAGHEKLEGFRYRIAGLMATQTGLSRKLTAKKADSEKYDGIAKSAAAAGNAEDVATAVKLKQAADDEVANLHTQIDLNEQQVTRLRATLEDGEKKVESAEAELTSLAARLEGAKIRKDLAKAESEMVGTGDVSSLGDLRKMVESEEDTADAQAQLTGGSSKAIEQRLEETYSGKEKVDDAVAAYMAAAKGAKAKK